MAILKYFTLIFSERAVMNKAIKLGLGISLVC